MELFCSVYIYYILFVFHNTDRILLIRGRSMSIILILTSITHSCCKVVKITKWSRISIDSAFFFELSFVLFSVRCASSVLSHRKLIELCLLHDKTNVILQWGYCVGKVLWIFDLDLLALAVASVHLLSIPHSQLKTQIFFLLSMTTSTPHRYRIETRNVSFCQRFYAVLLHKTLHCSYK